MPPVDSIRASSRPKREAIFFATRLPPFSPSEVAAFASMSPSWALDCPSGWPSSR